MFRLLLILSSLLSCCPMVSSQDCLTDFRSPIDYKTVLSGSYGEPRTRHFHAGIDYKQRRGVPYDTIFAAADGYISRISIQGGGYGNALYINHACNKTSVYAHLHDFSPEIRTYINEILYREKKYSINHYPKESKLLVRKGQYIGIMGNTGRSSGPHLHFEIRNSDSQTPLNPALVGFKPKDDIAPKIVGIMMYDLTPDNQEVSKSFHSATLVGKHQYGLKEGILMTGALKLGLGIRTYDQMNGASNHNGIYSLQLFIDGEESFSFKLDSIPFDKAKYIHSHMDYEEKLANKYVTKCFLNPANQLSIYSTEKGNGTIYPYEFRPTQIRIDVTDIEGNKATIAFQIKRHQEGYRNIPIDTLNYIKVNPEDSLDIDLGQSIITLNRGTFYQPQLLTFKNSSEASIDLRQERELATFRKVKIKHHINSILYPRYKYSFVKPNRKGEIESFRGRWEGDSTLVTFVDEMSKYEIGIDTIAPTIIPISLPREGSKRCAFKITDNFIPQSSRDEPSIEVFLNNEWILCQQDAKSNTIWFDMASRPSSEKHVVHVKVKDSARNSKELHRTFNY